MYHINLRRDTPAAVVTRNLFEISNNDTPLLTMLNNGDLNLAEDIIIAQDNRIWFNATDSGSSIFKDGGGDLNFQNETGTFMSSFGADTLISNNLIMLLTKKIILNGVTDGDTFIERGATPDIINLSVGDLVALVIFSPLYYRNIVIIYL